VYRTVNLDDQAELRAEEVDDEPTDHDLSAETQAAELPPSKAFPHLPLPGRRLATHFPG
jgi:hypothetical protein